MTDANSPNDAHVSPRQPGTQPGIPIAKLGGFLALVAIVGAAGFVWMDGSSRTPYPAKGEVHFNGKPLTTGYVEARPIKKRNAPERIVGPLDANGKFEIWSEIDTRMTKGIPAGKYKILLQAHHPSPGLGAPSPLLPDIYYDEARTPIEIIVTSDPEKNQFVIDQTGEFQPNVAGGAGRQREDSAEADPGKQR